MYNLIVSLPLLLLIFCATVLCDAGKNMVSESTNEAEKASSRQNVDGWETIGGGGR